MEIRTLTAAVLWVCALSACTPGMNAAVETLTWFEERMQSGALPSARYAVDLRDGKGTVIYGEQCIAQDICFTWQRWSAEQQKAVTGDGSGK